MQDHKLIHKYDITLPNLPTVLQGFRIAHLTDLHITHDRHRYKRITAELTNHQIDIVALTGDYMSGLEMPDASLPVMQRLINQVQPRYGFYGVFGNHDTPDLVKCFTNQLNINWLDDQEAMISDLPLQILGVNGRENTRPGSLGIATKIKHQAPNADPIISVVLSHFPCFLPQASDINADIMLSGHTHGGQLRLPWLGAFINHSDMPLKFSSGILRHGNTLGLVSRGLGEVALPLRTLCPPQLPIYTLRRGPRPGSHTHKTTGISPW